MIEEETISVEFQNVDDEYVQIFAFDSRDYFINWFKKIERKAINLLLKFVNL